MRKTVENLKYMTKEERINIVKDPEFRRKIFEERNHYPFVWCVQDLQGDEILSFLDDETLEYLEKDKRLGDKLNAIITSNNPYINKFLSTDKAISMLIDKIKEIGFYIPALDINFGRNFVNYLIDHNENINYIKYLDTNVQFEIISDPTIMNKLFNHGLPDDFLSNLEIKSINYLLKDKYFENKLLSYSKGRLIYLIDHGLTMPIHLQTNDDIINKFLYTENINEYHKDIVCIEKTNPYLKEELTKRRKKYYLNRLKQFDIKDGIFTNYSKILSSSDHDEYSQKEATIKLFMNGTSYEDKLKYLQEVSATEMLEILVDMYYEDFTYNFLKNVEIIINYSKVSNDSVVPEENLNIYKKIDDFYSLSVEDRLKLFDVLNNKNNSIEEFYDDFRNTLNSSYQSINDSLLDTSKINPINVTEDGTKIYYLDGEDFNLVVHKTGISREDSNIPIVWKDNEETASLSLIGSDNIGVFNGEYDTVILGFKKLNIDNIIHVYKSDSFTTKKWGSRKVPTVTTAENLNKETHGYNEILTFENNELKPDYIVCYDEVKPGDIEASKKLNNIPLIVVNTKKYKYPKGRRAINDEYKSSDEMNFIESYKRGR